MKQILAALFFAGFHAHAQSPAPVAVAAEGANVVAVLLADSGAVARARVVQVLTQRGYRVTAEAAGERVETAPTLAGNRRCSTVLQGLILGHVVLLSGHALCELHGQRPRPLTHSAYSHVTFQNYDCVAWGWNEVEAVAQALHGDKVFRFQHP
jgi:hypothetical protein